MEQACRMAVYYRENLEKSVREYNEIEKLHERCEKGGNQNCHVLKEDMRVLSGEINRYRKVRDEEENKCQIYQELSKKYPR